MLLLHPGGSHAEQFRRQIGFEAEDAVVVHPEGLGGHWNDGRRRGDGSLVHASDDVGFLLALVDRLVADGLADPAAIHVAGHGNGGMLALRLACEHPERLRRVAAVNATLPVDLACAPDGRAVATLLVHATADPHMPFAGGALGRPGRDLGGVISAARTAQVLAARNGCVAPQMRRADAGDGMPARISSYRACRAPLASVVIEGSGHGWPGSHYGPRMTRQIGPTAQSFDATRAIAAFFLEGRFP